LVLFLSPSVVEQDPGRETEKGLLLFGEDFGGRLTLESDYGLESAKPDLQSTFKKPSGDTAAG